MEQTDKKVAIGDQDIFFHFVDLAGNANAQDLIKNQDKFSYIVLCYSIEKKKSFENL